MENPAFESEIVQIEPDFSTILPEETVESAEEVPKSPSLTPATTTATFVLDDEPLEAIPELPDHLDRSEIAVQASNVCFTYPQNYFDISSLLADPLGAFTRPANPPVLEGISINVPKGAIYALLGSSGCGKTTLLKCVLGRLAPTGGSVRIFDQKPGSPSCPIPGPGVGYMPQELALFPEFTIRETLRYFGQLYRMSSANIKYESAYIIDLLHLPQTDRLVSRLSGGQQRRVSLACALLHKPPLMVLDEPTVGVDPLLRAAIWSHLETVCREAGQTVIITTHYIEEARAAPTIGLMRNGRMLVEENPEIVLRSHGLDRLEDVFLKLCIVQDSEKAQGEKKEEITEIPDEITGKSGEEIELSRKEPSRERIHADILNNNVEPSKEIEDIEEITEIPDEIPRKIPGKVHESSPNPLKNATKNHFTTANPSYFDPYRFNAQFTKNTIRLRRNLTITLFYCLIPALQFGLFVICSGKTPHSLPVAIFNEESPADLTAKFLSFLAPGTLIQNNVSSVEEGEQMVADGKAWAVMHFGGNFSSAMDDRRIDLASAENETILASNIHLYMDMSNQIVGLSVIQNIFLAFQKLMIDFLGSLGYNPNVLSTPIDITEVVYGTMDLTSMTELITPGVIILIAFFSTAAVTGLSLILEKKDGLLERSLVAGVKPFECLLSHIFTQTMVLIVQQLFLFATIFYVFEVPSRGPIGLIFLLCFLQGIAGIMFGLFVSSLLNDEVSAAIILLGSLFPTIMISGIFWPVQFISAFLYWCSILLPQTLAMESIRSILFRGWTLVHWQVALGFYTTVGWSVSFLLLAAFVFNKI